MNDKSPSYPNMGHWVRGILNDFKRRPEDAARELGITLEEIQGVLLGRLPLSQAFIEKACVQWPVNPRDFATVIDDAPNGVLVMRAEASSQSSRIMARNQKPYYEYRDTACSRVSSFRPEWIAELHVVADDDPNNPTVEWNNGHFMHQFTYFIGPVNFYYYDEQGNKQVAVMSTGDTMYISPFVPHTFATRKNPDGKQGLILALTFGNNLLGDAQHELSAISAELARHYAVDTVTPSLMTAQLIRYHMDCLSLSEPELARRSELDELTLKRLLKGDWTTRDYLLLQKIADALSVNLRDLLCHDHPFKTVEVWLHDQVYWDKPSLQHGYRVRQLASTPLVPLAKAVEILVEGNTDSFSDDFCVGLHQYLYNVGDTEVLLRWVIANELHEVALQPGDSVYLKPFVSHQFSASHGALLSLRIQSKISGDCIRELSYIGSEHVGRIVAEDRPWFNAEGSNG